MESAPGRGWGKFKCSPRKRAQGVRGPELSPHVDLIESSEHRTCVLRLLQTLGDALPHPVHFLLKGGQGLTARALRIKPSPLSPGGTLLARTSVSRTRTAKSTRAPGSLPRWPCSLGKDEESQRLLTRMCLSLTKDGSIGNGLISKSESIYEKEECGVGLVGPRSTTDF